MARLRRRAGEVAAIELDDIDWRAGELTAAGKGDRRERLPVPADVGQALAGYCQRGRPRHHYQGAVLAGPGSARQDVGQRGHQRSSPRRCRAGMPGVGAHRAAASRRDPDAASWQLTVRGRCRAAPAAVVGHGGLRQGQPGCAAPGRSPLARECSIRRLRQAADYVSIRRALGFKLDRHPRLLAQFVAYLEEAGASTVTTGLALAWATIPAGTSPDWHRARLSVARSFAAYLAALDPGTQVPAS